MQKLTLPEIEARLGPGSGWSVVGETIDRTYAFKNFNDAMSFVNRVATHAEQVQHHPDILVR